MQTQVDDLSKKKRYIIFRYLQACGLKIHEAGDGTRFNLDLLSKEQHTALNCLVESLVYIKPVNQIE